MALIDDLVSSGHDPWFIDSFNRLARGTEASLDGCLQSVGGQRVINGTKASCRCHFVARDGNQRVRVEALAAFMVRRIADYCIPRSRAIEAKQHYENTGSLEQLAALQSEAKSLFAEVEGSGEAGELLVFLLLERLLGVPQILCKMGLKTNAQVHVHGVDGIHARLLDDGTLAIYWCEAKMYANFASATQACISGIAPYLLDTGFGPLRRDLDLVRTGLDTGDRELDERLVEYFVEESAQATMREFRGAALIGFGLDEYPDPGRSGDELPAEVAAQVDTWFDSIGNRISHHGVDEVVLEVFCVPVPAADEFRAAFQRELKIS